MSAFYTEFEKSGEVIYASNGADALRLFPTVSDSETGQPGLDFMADQNTQDATVTLDLAAVHRLILMLQRFERKHKGA